MVCGVWCVVVEGWEISNRMEAEKEEKRRAMEEKENKGDRGG